MYTGVKVCYGSLMVEFDVNTTYYIRSVHSGLHVAFCDTGSYRVFQQDVTPQPPSALDVATRTFVFFRRPIDPGNPSAGISYYIANRHTGELATVMNAYMGNALLERYEGEPYTHDGQYIIPQQPGSIVPWGYGSRGVDFDDHMRFVLVPIDGAYLIRNVRSGLYWHIENAEPGPGAYVGQWELPDPAPAWFKFILERADGPVVPAGQYLIPYFHVPDAVRPPGQQVKTAPYYNLRRFELGSTSLWYPA